MSDPSSFGKYHARCRALGRSPHPRLPVFAAQYRLATGVKVVAIDGLADPSVEAYHACLRVALAWTALESFEKAIRAKGIVRLEAATLAAELRTRTGEPVLKALMASPGVNKKEANLLKVVRDGDTDDLRPVAYAMRNALFHGAFTAHAAKLQSSKSRRDLVLALGALVTTSVDARFTAYVNRMR